MSGYPQDPSSGAWADPHAAWQQPPAHGSQAAPGYPAGYAPPPAHPSGAAPAGSGVYPPHPSGAYPPQAGSGVYGPPPGSGVYPPQAGSGVYAPQHPSGAQPPAYGSGAVPQSYAGGDPYASYGSSGAYYGSQAAYPSHASSGGGSGGAAPGRGKAPEAPKGTPFGPYELVKELGRGGMGAVYQAYQPALKRYCALKVLHGAGGDSERLVHEAQTCAKLGKHPNIVQVFDAGVVNGTAYLTMEMVKGTPLDEVLKKDGPLSEELVLDIGYKVALALNHAHRTNLIHRDMKPANVILDEAKEPHVLDFGLAKDVVEGDSQFAGCVVGTPAYMPPEQFRAKDGKVDARADVYSLGATLYQLLCGKVPFDGGIQQIMFQLLTSPPPPLRGMVPVSRDLDAVIAKAMEKDPRDRYQSALEMADDLARVKAGEPPRARRLGPIGRVMRRAQRHPVLVTLGLVLALLGTATALYLKKRQQEIDELWASFAENLVLLTANEAQTLLQPAPPLLRELRIFAETDRLPVRSEERARLELGRELAIRQYPRGFTWLDYYYTDGSYVGVTKRKLEGDREGLLINQSWIIDPTRDDGGWETEHEILPDWTFRELSRDQRLFDGRGEDCYTVITESENGPVWSDPQLWQIEASRWGGDEPMFEWGVACSVGVRAPSGELRGVFTASLVLDALSRFLKHQQERLREAGIEGTRAFLLTRDGLCFARSDAPGDALLVARSQLDDDEGLRDEHKAPPEVAAAIAGVAGGLGELPPKKQVVLEYEHEGERWNAAIEVFELPGGLQWAVVVVARVRELRGDVDQASVWLARAGILAIVVAVLALVLGLVRRWLRVRSTVQRIASAAKTGAAEGAAAPPAA